MKKSNGEVASPQAKSDRDSKEQSPKKNIYNKILSVITNKTLWFILISFFLACAYAATATKSSDFYATNGDFQNYNPGRRFLNGQIPFKDFSVYLGCGEMLLDALGLLFIGNSFTHSLLVIRFFNAVVFWGLVYVISYIASNSHRFASIVSALFLGAVSLSAVYPEIFNSSKILEPGVSARLIRCGILALEFALIALAVNKIWKKNVTDDKKFIFTSALTGLITGSGILWSNDYGISCVVCISIIYAVAVIKLLKNAKAVFKNAGVYILAAIVGFLSSILLITRGHIFSYFENTLSTGSYQFWYYKMSDIKNYSIFDFQFNELYLVAIILFVYFLVRMLMAKTRKDTFKYSFPCAALLTGIFASEFYFKVSGGTSTNGLMLIVIICPIVYITSALVNAAAKKLTNDESSQSKKKAYKVSKALCQFVPIALCLLTIIHIDMYRAEYKAANSNLPYTEYLGNGIDGTMSTYLSDSIKSTTSVVGDNEFFSTYATANEVYCDKFQPTGFDYIIHVAGDNNRDKYLETFKNGNYKYVTTINPSYTGYEYWVKNSNWYFYRELFANYEPVEYNNVWIVWSKTDSKSNKYDATKTRLTAEQLDDGSIKLIAQSDEKITGTADVSISYKTDFNKSFFETGNINKMLMAHCQTELEEHNKICTPLLDVYFYYSLPQESDCYYLPITMKDGYGELIISPKPQGDVDLTLISAKLHDVFRYDYIDTTLTKR